MIEEMLPYNKTACKKQNISSIDSEHGIFILNGKRELIFADSMARKKLKYLKNSKSIRLYPIIENGETIFYFGFVDESRAKEKIFREEIAHYFFNPIAIAKGYISLLEEKELDYDTSLKIGKIREAIERIENVVKNIVMNGEIRE
jgi:signal transduction histidine kinase